MSVESADASVLAERARLIRSYHHEHGRPPTTREIGAMSAHSPTYYESRPGTWADALRSAGVPTFADLVRDALRERLDERYAWEDAIRLKSVVIGETVGISAQHAGRVLQRLAYDDDHPESFDAEELTVEQRNTNAHASQWIVRCDEGGSA